MAPRSRNHPVTTSGAWGVAVRGARVPKASSAAAVLVVDDDPSKRLAIKAVLAPLNLHVIEADSGLSALRSVMERDFAVILLDVRMPDIDGFETAALIRRRKESEMTPIIFITAFTGPEIASNARYVEGAVDFMTAPVSPDELRAKVSVFVNLFTRAEDLAAEARGIQESADQLEVLTDAAPVGIFRTDTDNRYVYTNARWSEVSGISREDALGRAWDTVFASTGPPDALVNEFETSDLTEVGQRFRLWSSDSVSRVVWAASEPIKDERGETTGWVGTLTDVTAEAEAGKERARFRSLIQNSRDVIAIIDPTGSCSYASSGIEEISGFSVDEFKAISLFGYIHPEDIQALAGNVQEIVPVPNATRTFEARARTKDRGWIWIEIRVANRLDNPSIQGIVLNFHDISERREAMAQLARSESVLAEGQSLSHVGSFKWDMRTNEHEWSDENYRLLGFEPGKVEPSFENLMARVHPEDRAMLGRATEESMTAGGPFALDFRVIHDGGAVRWLHGKGEVQSEEGVSVRIVGMSHDITDRRLAEEDRLRLVHDHDDEMRQSEQLFRGAFDVSQTGIALTLADGMTYVDVNQALCDMLGYTKEELMQLTWQDVTHPDDLQRNIKEFNRLIEGFEDVEHIEKRYVGKAANTIWIEVNKAVIRGTDGVPMFFVTHINDVTERHDAQLAREGLETQLNQSQKMEAVGQLAGGVAHDFNNILAVILNYAQFASDGLEPGDPRLTDIQEISKAGEKAARLVNQLLAFSRKEVMQHEVIDPNEVVTGFFSILSRALGEDIALEFKKLEGLPMVLADPGRLEQVILNVAVNARDAMPNGGVLQIETRLESLEDGERPRLPKGDYAVISMRDSGTGMDKATMDHVFEPFFTTKARGEGTGMGLSSAYGIVEQAGGSICVETNLGVGTMFSIYLPITDIPHVEAIKEAQPRSVHGTETILLVEDEDAVRAIVSRILKAQGYNVVPCSSGADALEFFSANAATVDLLLTDVVMPRMSGKELSDKATAIKGGLKTLFMSGYTDALIAQRGVLTSHEDLLSKPFDPDELLMSVRTLLDKRAA